MGDSQRQLWPRRYPQLTILAVLLPFSMLWGFWSNLRPAMTPLQNFYLGRYVRSAAAGWLGLKNGSALLYVVSAHRARPALNEDVVAMPVEPASKNIVPLLLSRHAILSGGIRLAEYPVRTITPAQLTTAAEYHAFLSGLVYGHSLLYFYRWPAVFLCGLWAVFIPIGARADWQRRQKARFGVKLRGPDLVTRRQFNRKVNGDGLAFLLSPEPGPLARFRRSDDTIRLRKRHEAQSISMTGDTGSGKTTLILQMLKQIAQRGETAFIYDPERQYVARFYDEARGDVILNPLDTRCPFWSPGEEIDGPTPLERLASARPVAQSLYPYRNGDQFFIKHAQDIFTYLLATFRPTAEELGRLFQNPQDLDRAVKGTEHEHTLGKNSPGQRQGILGTLNHAAYALRLVPDDDGRRRWSSREWTENPKGWVFITSTPSTEDALRPLQSLWIDLTILHTLSHGERQNVSKIWFVLDELATLQYLPKLQEGITRSRKTGNPFVLGFQGKAQLDKLYREDAETIISQPKTKFLLRNNEPNASSWMSKLLGEVELERPRETRDADGRRSWSQEIAKRELVLPSEIEGLDDLSGYLRYGNQVLKIRFPRMDLETTAPGLLLRDYSNVEPPVPLGDLLKATAIREAEQAEAAQQGIRKENAADEDCPVSVGIAAFGK